MAVNPLRLDTRQLTNAVVVVYTSPALTTTMFKRVTVSNITAGAITVNLWVTPSGGSAIQIITGKSIAANDSQSLTEMSNAVLNAGDSISVSASANTSLNFNASGFTVV